MLMIKKQYQFMYGSMQLTCSMNNNKTTRIYNCIAYKIIYVTWNLWLPMSLAPIHPKNLQRRRTPWHHCLPQLRWNHAKVFFMYLLKFVFESNCRTSFTHKTHFLIVFSILQQKTKKNYLHIPFVFPLKIFNHKVHFAWHYLLITHQSL